MSKDKTAQFISDYLNNLRSLQISDESLQHIHTKLKILDVKSKDTLLIPGEICKNMYVIVQGGFVCRYVHEKTGVAKTINFYLDDLHMIMACLDSYFTQVPTHCELKAISDSIVLALPKREVDLLRERDEYFARFYHDVVVTAMVEENELKTKLIAYSSKEKYDFIIKDMPSVIQKVPSKYIAEFCGISSEWLSKLKKQS
ncbi:MAG: hypothetical protein AAF388_22285 [Bacteroidota bacterium]